MNFNLENVRVVNDGSRLACISTCNTKYLTKKIVNDLYCQLTSKSLSRVVLKLNENNTFQLALFFSFNLKDGFEIEDPLKESILLGMNLVH